MPAPPWGGAARILLDIIADRARQAAVPGRRLIGLVHSNDPQIRFEPVGAMPVMWNSDEWADIGGSATDPLWGRLDPRVFVRNTDSRLLAVQAAFRAAYWLPRVGSIAVGTDDPAHLRELLDALRYEADPGILAAYRKHLGERSGRQPA